MFGAEMRVPVNGQVHALGVDCLGQQVGAEKRVNFRWFATQRVSVPP
jgi:hypothetical protein